MAGNPETHKKYTRPEELGPESQEAKEILASRAARGEGEEEDSVFEVLDKEHFEAYVDVGMSMSDIMMVFGKDRNEMDQWCWSNYHMDFKGAYGIILRMARKDLLEAFTTLAARGNPTAMQIAKELVLGIGADVGADTTRVVFVNDVPKGDGNGETK